MESRLIHDGLDEPIPPRPEVVGGKAIGLIELERLKLQVPPFFVITTEALRLTLELAGETGFIDQAMAIAQNCDQPELRRISGEVGQRIEQITLPPELVDAIGMALNRTISPESFLAVRSSVVGEDGTGMSFAGLHESRIGLKNGDQIFEAVKQVWASAFSLRTLVYRRARKLPLGKIRVAVVIQQVVEAACSGVMFTADPVAGNAERMVIGCRLGMGEGLVSGGLEADTWRVDKSPRNVAVERVEQGEKLILNLARGGLDRVAVESGQQNSDSLTDDQLWEIFEVGLVLERHFKRSQDVEFCFDAEGRLYLLQSRTLMGAGEACQGRGNQLIWDNSNIVESYSGITSPMTFSFIRRAYAIVYHCFADVMGISPRVVRRNRDVFENMLGLFRGRVYYNLKNWYRTVHLFPGFNYNRGFMESMMGLNEPLDLGEPASSSGFMRRWFVELPDLGRLLVRSTWNFIRIRSIVDRFQKNFHAHYDQWSTLDFNSMSPHQLRSLYHEMEDALLWKWKAPIINDFFVMIFYGLLKNLCVSWCGDSSGALQNDLICGEGGIESTAPTKMLLQLASLAKSTPELTHLILSEPLETLPELIRGKPEYSEFVEQFDRYLKLYGFRCVDELKLEEFSLWDRPEKVYRVIRSYLALEHPTALDVASIEARERSIRDEAEQRVSAALSKSIRRVYRRFAFGWVLKNARLGVKNRENMRFSRTRIYGLFREMLRAMGGHFASAGILDDSEDIFFLTIEEVWDYVKGTAVTTDLNGLAKLRRSEFEYYRDAAPVPDDRFETYGMAYHDNEFLGPLTLAPPTPGRPEEGMLQGTGCCAGVVVGKVKVFRSPDDHDMEKGDILVAERTDPGWIPLYPAAAGLLIGRGSVLSHSAVVAREMGIPTIVGIPGLVDRLTTGQMVRMDGRAGTVEIIGDDSLDRSSGESSLE